MRLSVGKWPIAESPVVEVKGRKQTLMWLHSAPLGFSSLVKLAMVSHRAPLEAWKQSKIDCIRHLVRRVIWLEFQRTCRQLTRRKIAHVKVWMLPHGVR